MQRRVVVGTLRVNEEERRGYHFETECACADVPHADKAALVHHDDLRLEVISHHRNQNLVRMQQAPVDHSASFDSMNAHGSAHIPNLTLFIVSCCIYPFCIIVETNFIDRRLVSLLFYVLYLKTRTILGTLGACLSESVSYIRNDFTEHAAR